MRGAGGHRLALQVLPLPLDLEQDRGELKIGCLLLQIFRRIADLRRRWSRFRRSWFCIIHGSRALRGLRGGGLLLYNGLLLYGRSGTFSRRELRLRRRRKLGRRSMVGQCLRRLLLGVAKIVLGIAGNSASIQTLDRHSRPHSVVPIIGPHRREAARLHIYHRNRHGIVKNTSVVCHRHILHVITI